MIGQQIDGVDQTMVSQAVGVVAESHDRPPEKLRTPAFQSGSIPD